MNVLVLAAALFAAQQAATDSIEITIKRTAALRDMPRLRGHHARRRQRQV